MGGREMEKTNNRNVIFAQYQRIETKRLILRPVILQDAKDMYEYTKVEETTYFVFPMHQSITDTKNNIDNCFMAAPLGKYGIELKDTRQLIGTIDLRVKESQNNAELGYTLNKKYWGNGIIPEACQALLKLGFEELNLIRIYAYHDVENLNSGRVMDKIGMKKEEVIPDARCSKGKVVTLVLQGITQNEWLAQKE